MQKNKNALIVFQKNPVLGKVKTRLAATLGEHKALDIYLQLLQHTYKVINELDEVDTYVYFSDNLESNMDEVFVEEVYFHVQQGADLGSRMKNAFEEVFSKGYQKVLIIGTDCPEISPTTIHNAFNILDSEDVVFGPALDGGYYLLGMRDIVTCLFENMTWSHDNVLTDSIKKLDFDKKSFSKLEILSDIDNEADWERYKTLISQTI